MDWDDPAARARLISEVGPERYETLRRENFRATIVETVNGFDIRPVGSRFGRLFACYDQRKQLSMVAFPTLDDARAYCKRVRREP